MRPCINVCMVTGVLPARWRRCGRRALRRLPGAASVAMVLVAPAVCALGDLLPAQPHPQVRMRCSAQPTAAKGSAAGAGVSDAPRWVPRGRRASIEASKVAGKGTPLHHWGSQKIKMHSRLCKALAGFMAIFPLRAMVLPNTPQSLRG